MNYASKAEWNAELARLKAFFSETEIPAPGDHVMEGAIHIHDLKKAIGTFMIRAEENAGNPTFQGTLAGLQMIEKYLKGKAEKPGTPVAENPRTEAAKTGKE